MLRVCQLLQTNTDSCRMIRNVLNHLGPMIADFHKAVTAARGIPNPINPPARKLSLIGQIKQSVLETGRTQIGNKNFHGEQGFQV